MASDEEERALQYRRDHRAWRLAEIARVRALRGDRIAAERLKKRTWPLRSGQAVPLLSEQRRGRYE